MPKTQKDNKTTTKTTIVSKEILGTRITDSLKKKKTPLTKAQTDLLINEFLEETKKALIRGEEIRLLGYFSLKTVTQKPRIAMNLQTKKKMNVPAKRVPKVKFSDVLKKEVSAKK